MSLRDATIQGLFSTPKSWGFLQVGPCPPLQQLSLKNRGVLCLNRAAPGQEMLGSTRAGDGRQVVALVWPWAWGRKALWGGGAVTPLSQSHGMHLLKWAASWSCKTKGRSDGLGRSSMYRAGFGP